MAGAYGQSALAAAPEALGKVHFDTSCKPEAQQHSTRPCCTSTRSGYRASQKTFEDALKADPECAIAYWASR